MAGGSKHFNPLYIANGIVIRVNQRDATLFEKVSVLKYLETFDEFSYAAVNSAVLIQTKQEFETFTLVSFRNMKAITGEAIYALNGYYNRLCFADSTEAVKAIDFLITKR